MSSRWLEVAGRSSRAWRWAGRWDRPTVTWWPASLPGSDLDETPGRHARRPVRRKIRRGRIQLVAA